MNFSKYMPVFTILSSLFFTNATALDYRVCEFTSTYEKGQFQLTYHPDEDMTGPVRANWIKTISDPEQGTMTLSAHWRYFQGQAEYDDSAQFYVQMTPKEKGPKLVRVEFDPWAYSRTIGAMRYGSLSRRGDLDNYGGSAHWKTVLDLEAGAEDNRLFLRVQDVSKDTVNQNWAGNTAMSIGLPANYFSDIESLLEKTIAKGNTAVMAEHSDCHDQP